MSRVSAVASLCFGLALLAAAAVDFFSAAGDPSLVVTDTDMEVLGCAVGQEKEVVVRLHNTGSRPLSVVGLAEC